MTAFGFDVGNTKPASSFDPLPPGWYAMRVTKADVVEGRSADTGLMCKMEFEIIEHAHPEFAGRKAWANFCHQHANKQTREIAQAQISAICRAIGKPHAQHTDEVLGGELRVKLSVKPADGQYDARNETRGFKALGEVVPAAQAAPAAAAPSSAPTQAGAAPAAAPARAPWKR